MNSHSTQLRPAPFDGAILWNAGNMCEEGITRLKDALQTNPGCSTDLSRVPGRSFEKIIEIYARLAAESPDQVSVERGLAQFDITSFCRAPSRAQYYFLLPLRNVAAAILPCCAKAFGGLTSVALSRENLVKEIKSLYSQRVGTKVDVSIKDSKVILHCPYKKLPADFTNLPSDIWKLANSYLPLKDQLSLHSSCKKLRTLGKLGTAFTNDSASNIVRHGFLKAQSVSTMLSESQTLSVIKDAVTSLNLSNTRISAQMLRDIFTSFPKLVALDLRHTDLSAECLDELANFTKLIALHLPEKVLEPTKEKSLEAMFKKMTTLETVSFTQVKVPIGIRSVVAKNHKIFSYLPAQLKKLCFSNCVIRDAHIMHLQHLTCLEEFEIKSPSIHFKGATFNCLPISLTCLSIENLHIQDAVLTALQRFTNLKQLRIIDCNNIKGTTFASLPMSLLSLRCDFCFLSQEGINQLGTLLQLREFSYNEPYTEEGVHPIETLRTLPQSIQVLSLRNWDGYHLDGLGLAELSQLATLDITANMIDEALIRALPTTLKKLFCGSDRHEQAITLVRQFSRLSELQELHLTCYSDVLDEAQLLQLPETLRFLHFNLQGLTAEDRDLDIPPAFLQELQAFQRVRQNCAVKLFDQ